MDTWKLILDQRYGFYHVFTNQIYIKFESNQIHLHCLGRQIDLYNFVDLQDLKYNITSLIKLLMKLPTYI